MSTVMRRHVLNDLSGLGKGSRWLRLRQEALPTSKSRRLAARTHAQASKSFGDRIIVISSVGSGCGLTGLGMSVSWGRAATQRCYRRWTR